MKKIFVIMRDGEPISILDSEQEVTEFYKSNINWNLTTFETTVQTMEEAVISNLTMDKFNRHYREKIVSYIAYKGRRWLGIFDNYNDARRLKGNELDIRIKEVTIFGIV